MAIACILSGSNINPIQNTCRALRLLQKSSKVTAISKSWTTTAIGSQGPEFINMAYLIETCLELQQIKPALLSPIEHLLGRKRSADKNAPRTIDLDLIVYNQTIIDHSLWIHPHIALPVSELMPDLMNPDGVSLRLIASDMRQTNLAYCCVDLGTEECEG